MSRVRVVEVSEEIKDYLEHRLAKTHVVTDISTEHSPLLLFQLQLVQLGQGRLSGLPLLPAVVEALAQEGRWAGLDGQVEAGILGVVEPLDTGVMDQGLSSDGAATAGSRTLSTSILAMMLVMRGSWGETVQDEGGHVDR